MESGLVAATLGAAAGGLLLALLGYQSGHLTAGAIAGVFIGGVMGHGAEVGYVGAATVFAAIFATVSMLCGMGVDDYSGVTAISGAAVGAGIGWLWRKPRAD